MQVYSHLRRSASSGTLASAGVHNGSLITDLLASVEKAERASVRQQETTVCEAESRGCPVSSVVKALHRPNRSQPEQLPQPFGLGPADRYLALLLIVHAQLIRALEPGHDLANPVDIHKIGAVGPPEHSRIEAVE